MEHAVVSLFYTKVEACRMLLLQLRAQHTVSDQHLTRGLRSLTVD
jgi:hypothetical protein